jgi:hypothetical protein
MSNNGTVSNGRRTGGKPLVARGFSHIPLAEAAKRAGLTTSRLRQMLLAGQLRGRKVNQRAWVISPFELRRLIRLRRRISGGAASTDASRHTRVGRRRRKARKK